MSTDKRKELIAKLPKAELHVHIEGTLLPELLFSLAAKNNVTIPYKSLEEVRAAYAFEKLDDFLALYYQGMSVLITAEDFSELAEQYARRASADGVVYAEVFFDPQGHLCRGVSLQTAYDGLQRGFERARRACGIVVRLIFSFLRHLPEAESLQLLQDETNPDSNYARELFAKKAFIAVGLDSSELPHPPENFARLYAYCRDVLRVPYLVAHAGEEGPPEYIHSALDKLGVDRIDHGVACRHDAALREELRRREMPLTVCPYSNVDLGVFRDGAECAAAVVQLLREGLLVTLNSDDPAYFSNGTFANAQYELLVDHGPDVTAGELKQLALNSFRGSFLPEGEKQAFYAKVEQAYEEVMGA